MDDPVGLTQKVLEAGEAAGVRLLISKVCRVWEPPKLSLHALRRASLRARFAGKHSAPPAGSPRPACVQGWGGLGEGLDPAALPASVFLLEQACPHDWLFPRCAAVVHHGDAGTTAAGLKAGARLLCAWPSAAVRV